MEEIPVKLDVLGRLYTVRGNYLHEKLKFLYSNAARKCLDKVLESCAMYCTIYHLRHTSVSGPAGGRQVF